VAVLVEIGDDLANRVLDAEIDRGRRAEHHARGLAGGS
jgi:hypothetical protein